MSEKKNGKNRELPPDWFCEGQTDLIDLIEQENQQEQREEGQE